MVFCCHFLIFADRLFVLIASLHVNFRWQPLLALGACLPAYVLAYLRACVCLDVCGPVALACLRVAIGEQVEQTRGRAELSPYVGTNSSGLNPRAPSATEEPYQRRRQASVVIVDRTLDLSAAASRGGSLLQRVMSSLPRAGSTPPSSSNSSSNTSSYLPSASYSSPSLSSRSQAQWSPSASAHQQDVAVILPALAPGLGLPSSCSPFYSLAEAGGLSGKGEGGGGGGRAKGEPQLEAMKALAGFPWPAPTSLCHPTGAGRLVHAMSCLGEEEGQAALVAALERSEKGWSRVCVCVCVYFPS